MGALDKLDAFCRPVSDFWCGSNNSLAEFGCNHDVDLSLCFEDTAVLYGICALFWLMVAMELICSPYPRPRIRHNWLNITRMLLTVVVMATAVCDLGYTIHQGTQAHGHPADFQYLSPIILIFSMVLAAVFIQRNRREGVVSSAVIFLFWTALALYGAIKLRTLLLTAKNNEDGFKFEDVFRFSTFCVQYAAILVQFLLAFLPEPHITGHYRLGVEPDRKPCPEETATFLSRITWWWISGFIWRGWRQPLEYSDLTDLNQYDKSRVIAPEFQHNWDKEIKKAGITFDRLRVHEQEYQPVNLSETHGVQMLTPVERARGGSQQPKEPSLFRVLVKSFGVSFMGAAVFRVVQILLTFASPQILKLMIQYTESHVEGETNDDWKGYFYAVLIFLTAVFQSILLHVYFHRVFRVGMHIRAAIIAAVYKKALRLSNRARQNSTVGEIVNLMSVDAQRLNDLVTYLHSIWAAPFQIVLALIFLWFSMGPSIFAGFAIMVLLIPINIVVAAMNRKYQVRQMVQKDSRIKLVSEVLNGIKVIKLYAWEIPFQRQIMGIRNNELKVLKASAYLNAATAFTWTCAPFLVSLATFATFVLVHRNSDRPEDQLTADKAFVALALFNILRYPLSMLPYLISLLVESSVSVKRLKDYLKSDELDPAIVQWRPEPATEYEDAISVIGGKFTWDSPARPTLSE